MFTLTLNADRLNLQLEALRLAVGADMQAILTDEGIAFSKTCVNFTPPFKSPGTAAGAKAVGELAIERELKSYVSEARSEFLSEVSREWGLADVRGFTTRTDRTKLAISFDHVDPAGDQISIFHEAARDRRGKIPLERKIRNQWRAGVLTVQGTRDPYLRQTQSHVGRWKATWGFAAAKLGGQIPGWISRHFGNVASLAIFDASHLRDEKSPWLIIGSRAPGNARMASSYNLALRVRAEAIGRRIKLIASGYKKDTEGGHTIRAHGKETHADRPEN